MTKILCFAGKKRSGKNSAYNYMAYLELVNKTIDVDGQSLTLDTMTLDESDGLLKLKLDEGMLEFDFENPYSSTIPFAKQYLWPFVKNYSFAYKLKKMAIELFGLLPGQMYGNDKQKNSPTKFHWKQVSLEAAKGFGFKVKADIPDRLMTAREFLQIFGTEYVRVFKDDAWVTQTLNAIKKDKPEIAVITDCRFENELQAVKKAGGKVVYLTRQISDDKHASENGISPDSKLIDAVIDNNDMDIQRKNFELFLLLQKWDMLQEEFKDVKINTQILEALR